MQDLILKINVSLFKIVFELQEKVISKKHLVLFLFIPLK